MSNSPGPDDETAPDEETVISTRDTANEDTRLSARHPVDDDTQLSARHPADEDEPDDDDLHETVLRGRRASGPRAASAAAAGPGAPPDTYGIRSVPTRAPIARVDLASSLPRATLPAAPEEIQLVARKKARRRGRLLIGAMVIATGAIATGVVYGIVWLLAA
ncbi:hypothetical protein [Glaciihabitans tibetensis]|uniref:hypothetical protein n=1 Tax=Glaciihabitans tibetensis TaxID=1266600 RepID=UPI000D055820|nr:hypothetical protein [Glaciihabitans tibetensis]